MGSWFDPRTMCYFSVAVDLGLSLMVICLSTLIKKSCGISSQLLAEKLVITA